MLAISAAQARRFLVRRQLLDPPRGLPATPASVLEVVRRLGSLQFDPLEVPGARNHDLALHARIAGYRPAWCDGWLYGAPAERRLFEAYNKSLNILPIDELPYYGLAWDRAEARYEGRIFQERAAACAEVRQRLEREGPLSTADISRRLGGPVDWHWAPTAEGRAVLEALFEAGRVAIARREGSRRFFDLSERLFPAELLGRRVKEEESARHRLLSRYRAVGLMGKGGAAELVYGTGTAAERARIVAGLVDEGVLVPVEVEGLGGPRYVLAEELPLLHAAAKAAPVTARGMSFIAPLDALLWDRRLLRELFHFDYIWEVYVPEARRRHGYYVLPILFGDELVGRIEPRLDRQRGTLRVLGLSFEAGFVPMEAPGFVPALGEALAAYSAFVGASKISWPRKRALAGLVGDLKSWRRDALPI